MSDYLVRELERYGVAVRYRSEIAQLHGEAGQLQAVTLASGERLAFSYLFLGAHPCTDWLGEAIAWSDGLATSRSNALGRAVS
jgi:phytoene dehydrogenase-like protein